MATIINSSSRGRDAGRVLATLVLALTLAITGCASSSGTSETPPAESSPASQQSAPSAAEGQASTQRPGITTNAQDDDDAEKDGEMKMRMSIGGADVSVEWEDNQAVADLRAMATEGPVTVELSIYGGFEQVGPLGASLTASDVQTTTEPGDIVLYAGNQISVFYGSNSWAYTKLGHIADRTAEELAEMLGNDDVSITITVN